MNAPRISILTPTRRRPQWVKRLITSAVNTAHGKIELIFYVDNDDPSKDEVWGLQNSGYPKDTILVAEGDRCVLSEMWNRCAGYAQSDILMQCGDDIVFQTPGWDDLIVQAFDQVEDKILFVHGRDGFQDANLGTHGFLHRRWVETVGYFVPPYFASDYNDLWLTEVADALGRRKYIPEIYTEHMHPVVGKGPMDITHNERLTRHRLENVEQIWRNTADKRLEDVQKLRGVMR